HLPAPRPPEHARAAAPGLRRELRRGADYRQRDPLRAGRPYRELPRVLLAASLLSEGEGVLGPRIARSLGVPAQPHPGAGRPAPAARLGAGVHLVRLLVHRRELLVPPALAGRGGSARDT